MNTSFLDVMLEGAWKELFAASGIAPSTSICIQNKTSTHVFLSESGTAPLGEMAGFALAAGDTAVVSQGQSAVWAKGEGPIFVQVMV